MANETPRLPRHSPHTTQDLFSNPLHIRSMSTVPNKSAPKRRKAGDLGCTAHKDSPPIPISLPHSCASPASSLRLWLLPRPSTARSFPAPARRAPPPATAASGAAFGRAIASIGPRPRSLVLTSPPLSLLRLHTVLLPIAHFSPPRVQPGKQLLLRAGRQHGQGVAARGDGHGQRRARQGYRQACARQSARCLCQQAGG